MWINKKLNSDENFKKKDKRVHLEYNKKKPQLNNVYNEYLKKLNEKLNNLNEKYTIKCMHKSKSKENKSHLPYKK